MTGIKAPFIAGTRRCLPNCRGLRRRAPRAPRWADSSPSAPSRRLGNKGAFERPAGVALAPCLIPAYLLSARFIVVPPPQGSAFTASPSTAAAIKPRGLQLGVKGRSGAGGALSGKGPWHITPATKSSPHPTALLQSPDSPSSSLATQAPARKTPAQLGTGIRTHVGQSETEPRSLMWVWDGAGLSEGDPSPKRLCLPAAPGRA